MDDIATIEMQLGVQYIWRIWYCIVTSVITELYLHLYFIGIIQNGWSMLVFLHWYCPTYRQQILATVPIINLNITKPCNCTLIIWLLLNSFCNKVQNIILAIRFPNNKATKEIMNEDEDLLHCSLLTKIELNVIFLAKWRIDRGRIIIRGCIKKLISEKWQLTSFQPQGETSLKGHSSLFLWKENYKKHHSLYKWNMFLCLLF